jgi:hypothetical protein
MSESDQNALPDGESDPDGPSSQYRPPDNEKLEAFIKSEQLKAFKMALGHFTELAKVSLAGPNAEGGEPATAYPSEDIGEVVNVWFWHLHAKWQGLDYEWEPADWHGVDLFPMQLYHIRTALDWFVRILLHITYRWGCAHYLNWNDPRLVRALKEAAGHDAEPPDVTELGCMTEEFLTFTPGLVTSLESIKQLLDLGSLPEGTMVRPAITRDRRKPEAGRNPERDAWILARVDEGVPSQKIIYEMSEIIARQEVGRKWAKITARSGITRVVMRRRPG